MLEYVGTKWNPHIHSIAELEGHTHLGFESAWTAPNPLLARMHQLTGWKIVNRHDDPDAEHDLVYFNLARLWPERFEHEDGPHFRNADTAWMEEHLGSAYNPGIGEFGGDGQLATLLHFETPWFPSNPLAFDDTDDGQS